MATTNQASIVLTLQDRFSKEMEKIRRSAKDSKTDFSELKSAVAGFVSVGALTVFAKSIIDVGAQLESANKRFEVLLGSVEQGRRAMAGLQSEAKRVAVDFAELLKGAQVLGPVAEGDADRLLTLVQLATDLQGIFNDISFQEIASNLSRAFQAGINSADLFRDTGIKAFLGFQAGVEYSAQETRDKILAAWRDTEKGFAGAAQQMNSTWGGTVSQLQDRWFDFRRVLADAGLFDVAKGAATDLNDSLTELFDTNTEKGRSFGRIIANISEGLILLQTAVRGVQKSIQFNTVKAASAIDNLTDPQGAPARRAGVRERIRGLLGQAPDEEDKRLIEERKRILDERTKGIEDELAAIEREFQDVIDEGFRKILEVENKFNDSLNDKGVEQFGVADAGAAFTGGPDPKEQERQRKEAEADAKRAAAEQKRKEEEARREAERTFEAKNDLRLAEAAAETDAAQRSLELIRARNDFAIELEKKSRIEAAQEINAAELAVLDAREKELGVARGILEAAAQSEPLESDRIKAQEQLVALKQRELDIDQQRTLTLERAPLDVANAANESVLAAERNYQDALIQTNALIESGVLSREDGQARISAANATAIAEIEAQIEALQRLAELSPELAENIGASIEAAQVKMANLTTSTTTLGDAFVTTFGTQAGGAIGQFVQSLGRGSGGFAQMIRSMVLSTLGLIAQLTIAAAIKSFLAGGSNVPGDSVAASGTAGFLAAFAAAVAGTSFSQIPSFAQGGPVPGHDPFGSDDVSARLTRGEFVQPVSAVDYYGKGAMEAIRQRLIPPDVFAAYDPPIHALAKRNFATGGPVVVESRGSGGSAGVQVVPGFVASESTMEALVNGGEDALIRFLDDRGYVRQ